VSLAEDVLDAFLLAAGMHQILEDSTPKRRLVKGAAGTAAGERLVATLVSQLASGVAASVVNGGNAVLSGVDPSAAAASVDRVLAGVPPRVRRQVVRLPNCYRSFDQHPADSLELARRFASRWEDRDRPLAVVGLRTSGSYLAPLTVAFLESLGFHRISVSTIRPGSPGDRPALEALRHRATDGALAVVVDDPPVTGRALARAAGRLQSLGWPQEAIVLLVASFSDDGDLPQSLASYPSVVLPWERWHVPGRLADEEVAATAASLVGVSLPVDGGDRLTVKTVESAEGIAGFRPRGHARGAFRIYASDGSSAPPRHAVVGVEGCGIGYLGRHASAVAGRLGPRVPAVLHADDGLLFREWLPDQSRLRPDDLTARPRLVARLVAGYVHERHRALPVAHDTSRRLKGRSAVAELVGQMLASAFGPAGGLAQRPCQEASLRLLAVAEPSVIDGKMSLANWYWSATGDLRKAGAWDRAFSNRDLYCYDPLFDLAGAAADAEVHGCDDFPALAREAYEELSGRPVGDQRWLLYGLFHHVIGHQISQRAATAGNVGPVSDAGSVGHRQVRERCVTRWLTRYLAAACLSPPAAPGAGPLVAVALEGTMESPWMGFWAPRRRSVLALGALAAHGYRPVLLSERPAAEVRDHCQAWHLAGGVAESGGRVYDGARDRVISVEGRGAWDPGLALLAQAAGADPPGAVGAAPAQVIGGDRSGAVRTAPAQVIGGDRSGAAVVAAPAEDAGALLRRLVGHLPGGCPLCARPGRESDDGRLLEPVLDAIGAPATVRVASVGRLAWRALTAAMPGRAGRLER
jgi:hypothetical protein